MSNETISIEIPAPPDGWVYDGMRYAETGEMYFDYMNDGSWAENGFHRKTDFMFPCAVRAQEPRELVRFYVYKDNTRRMHCEDDCGNILMMDDSPPDYCGLDDIIWGGFDRDSGWVTEFHPRLTIRSDGKGGWVAESWTHTSKSHCVDDIYPCDRNGNSLDPYQENGGVSTCNEPHPATKDKPAVEGWVREGDYWLAPIEWGNNPMVKDGGARFHAMLARPLGKGYGYRCVGFLRMDELEDYRAKCYRRPLKHCVRTCPCLLDWQATHAVMKKEGE